MDLDVEVFGGEGALTALVLDLNVVLHDVLLNAVWVRITLTELALSKNQEVFAKVRLICLQDEISMSALNVILFSIIVFKALFTFLTVGAAAAQAIVFLVHVLLEFRPI